VTTDPDLVGDDRLGAFLACKQGTCVQTRSESGPFGPVLFWYGIEEEFFGVRTGLLTQL
jgi:hypothetical protein